MSRFVSVLVDGPFFQCFDYSIETSVPVYPGLRVEVPFGKQKTKIGLIWEVKETSDFPKSIKKVLRCLDQEPLLSVNDLTFLEWTARYYHAPLGEVVFHALPIVLRKGDSLPCRRERVQWNLPDASKLSPSLKKLKACLDREPNEPPWVEQLLEQGFRESDLKRWEQEQKIVFVPETHRCREALPSAVSSKNLTDEQKTAIAAVDLAHPSFRAWVLQGITGSGKTEVYFAWMDQVLALGKAVLYLVPEIGLVPQVLSRIRSRWPQALVSVLHSGLNDKQRAHAWSRAQSGLAHIILGTRSAVFTPIVDLGLIVVDEEHDPSFKQQEGFLYSARDLSVVRAQQAQVPVILGSATPALETMHRAIQGHYGWLKLRRRATHDAAAPAIELVDLRQQKSHSGVSQSLKQAIQRTLAQGQQVLLFLNRRGFAPCVLCQGCGWVADCKHCDAHLYAHRSPPHLQCHHCGRTQSLITQCPSCQQPLRSVGLGTERLEEYLNKHFPEASIVRFDRDNIKNAKTLEQALDEVHQQKHAIVLGTQMLSKGHDFSNMGLVALLDVDGALFSSDFRAVERLGQMLMQVSGRAGRAGQPCQVLLQTHFPHYPLLQVLLNQGFDAFAEALLVERAQAGLPPSSYLVVFRASAKHQKTALNYLKTLREALEADRERAHYVMCVGPIPAAMERRQGQYRVYLWVYSVHRKKLHEVLDFMVERLQHQKNHRVSWNLDVDPQSMD